MQTLPPLPAYTLSLVSCFLTSTPFDQTPGFHIQGKFLSYSDYIKCVLLGDTTKEEQLLFFRTSEYTCSMPQSKHHLLFKKAKALYFTSNQPIYSFNQPNNNTIYIVRKGLVHYQHKAIKLMTFEKGSLFGEYQQTHQNKVVSARVESHSCLLYSWSKDVFQQLIKPYCLDVLYKRHAKIDRFLQRREVIFHGTMDRSKSLNSIQKRAYNLEKAANKLMFNSTQLGKHKPVLKEMSSTTRVFSHENAPQFKRVAHRSWYRTNLDKEPNPQDHFQKSKQMENQQLTTTSYWKLKYDGPLKSFPLTLQRATQTSSEFKDIDKLLPLPKNKAVFKVKQNDILQILYRRNKFKKS